MNLPCEVIRDLLPLYRDGVCGETSRHFVSGHLQNCAACRQELAGLEAALAQPAPSDESAPLKAVAKALEKKRRKVMWRSILAAVLIVAVSLGAYAALAQIPISVPLEYLTVTEVAQLSSGDLVYVLDSSHPKAVRTILHDYTIREGIVYITAQYLLFGPQADELPSRWEPAHPLNGLVDLSGGSLTAVRLGTEEDYMTLWEQGQPLPAASEETEQYFAWYSSTHEAPAVSGAITTETPPPDPLGLSDSDP